MIDRDNRYRVQLPADMLKGIDDIETWLAANPPDAPPEKIAVFDLDNTLLIGDIGDALYVRLKLKEQEQPVTVTGTPLPFSWTGYLDFLAENGKEIAYKRIISSMAGVPIETVIETTRQIMALQPGTTVLHIEEKTVPVPRVNPVMHALTGYLRSLDYNIYIISASIQPAVRFIAREFFNIPPENAIGMVPTITMSAAGEIVGSEIDGPVTVTEGKVTVYQDRISTHPPLITAGDSPTDIPMLNLTHQKGMIIYKTDGAEAGHFHLSPSMVVQLPV